MPAKDGSTPAAFIASVPRLACTVTSTNLPDDAECTQASFPATRNPVSSKCATSAATSALAMASSAGAMSAGDLPGHRGERARGRRAAEHLRHRGTGPVPGQELPVPQVRAQRGGPRPVLHRRGHPVRRPPPGARPAAAALQLDHLVLGDLGPHRRDLGHLPPLHPGLCRPVQARRRTRRSSPARAGPGDQDGQSAASSRPAAPSAGPAAPGILPQRLRRRLAQPVRRWRLRGVLRVLPHPRGKISDLRLKDRDLLPQPRDLCIPLPEQLPQPRVRRTQPGNITRHTGRIGHAPQAATASPR